MKKYIIHIIISFNALFGFSQVNIDKSLLLDYYFSNEENSISKFKMTSKDLEYRRGSYIKISKCYLKKNRIKKARKFLRKAIKSGWSYIQYDDKAHRAFPVAQEFLDTTIFSKEFKFSKKENEKKIKQNSWINTIIDYREAVKYAHKKEGKFASNPILLQEILDEYSIIFFDDYMKFNNFSLSYNSFIIPIFKNLPYEKKVQLYKKSIQKYRMGHEGWFTPVSLYADILFEKSFEHSNKINLRMIKKFSIGNKFSNKLKFVVVSLSSILYKYECNNNVIINFSINYNLYDKEKVEKEILTYLKSFYESEDISKHIIFINDQSLNSNEAKILIQLNEK